MSLLLFFGRLLAQILSTGSSISEDLSNYRQSQGDRIISPGAAVHVLAAIAMVLNEIWLQKLESGGVLEYR